MPGDPFEPFKQVSVNNFGPELFDKFVVVDWFDFAVLANLASDAPRIDILLLRCHAGSLGALHICSIEADSGVGR